MFRALPVILSRVHLQLYLVQKVLSPKEILIEKRSTPKWKITLAAISHLGKSVFNKSTILLMCTCLILHELLQPKRGFMYYKNIADLTRR